MKIFLKLFPKIAGSSLFFWSKLLFWLAILLIFFVQGIAELDPDFAWHLRVGQDIALNKQVPKVEEYIFPTLGESWVDHEWLSNLLLFLIYDFFGRFGYWVLGSIFALIATGTLWLITRNIRKYFVTKLQRWDFFALNSLFITLGMFALLRSYGIRLQVLTWLFFTLPFIFYLKISKEQNWQYLWAFPLLFGFWANLHGTFALGIGIACLLLALLFWQHPTPKRRIQIALTIPASILATLLTPYGLELWKLIAGEYTQNTAYLNQIFEWLPLYAAPYIEWYSTFYISLICLVFIISLRLKKIPRKTNALLYCSFVFLMLLMAVKARRFVPLFVLCSWPFAVFTVSRLLTTSMVKKWFGFLVLIVTLPLILYQGYFISTVPLDLLTQNTVMSPYRALRFIQEDPELSEKNIYNQYGWGGYLVWMLPEKLHFIDGRMPQKPLTNGNSLIEEYFEFRADPQKAQAKLGQYQIGVVLLEQEHSPEELLSGWEIFLLKYIFAVDLTALNAPYPLRQYLEKNWQKVYSDEISVIYRNPKDH